MYIWCYFVHVCYWLTLTQCPIDWMSMLVYYVYIAHVCRYHLSTEMCVLFCIQFISPSLQFCKDTSLVNLCYVMWYPIKLWHAVVFFICDCLYLPLHCHQSLCLHVSVYVSYCIVTNSATIMWWQLWLMWSQIRWCVDVGMSMLFTYAIFLSFQSTFAMINVTIS